MPLIVSWDCVIWSKRICVVDSLRCFPELWRPGLCEILFVLLTDRMYTRQEAHARSIDMNVSWIRMIRTLVVHAFDCLDCLQPIVGVEGSLIPAAHVDRCKICGSHGGIFVQQICDAIQTRIQIFDPFRINYQRVSLETDAVCPVETIVVSIALTIEECL